QHGQYMTPFLRKEVLDRGLDKHIGLGRVFRIVHESTQPRKPVALTKATPAELVAQLSSANGWHRYTAQQLLVERGELSAVPELKKLATTGAAPLGRLHALWTLEGLNKLDTDLLFTMLSDKDANVRASAAALCRNVINRQADATYVQELAVL